MLAPSTAIKQGLQDDFFAAALLCIICRANMLNTPQAYAGAQT
jgi:hypothetical protein